MSLALLLVLVLLALGLGLIRGPRLRQLLLLSASVLAVFALQPALPVRGLDFWLPTLTLALAALGWALTSAPGARTWRENWPAGAVLVGLPLLLGLTRLLDLSTPLTASTPPAFVKIGLFLAVSLLVVALALRFSRPTGAVLTGLALVLLVAFLVLKLPSLAEAASRALRAWAGQSTAAASALDLRWLGFSYIAFRLLHTLRDRQSGRLPEVTLGEYVTYLVFFPALSAGPIDRIERFVVDLRRAAPPSTDQFGQAARRLVIGLFKKFALADSLALIALNSANALQVRSTGWAWVMLYAYTFQIFLDFSGYTDIAIGMGRLMGFQLPENFNAPLRRTNLTQFWNNWHMTLTQWFRAYFFNPLTRALRSARQPLPAVAIIFLTQVATMVLIGLWHGVSWNFVLWGLWHGLGLFLHNRWSDCTRSRTAQWQGGLLKALQVGGWFLTFHYVALGWVFFALPSVGTALRFYGLLFGGG